MENDATNQMETLNGAPSGGAHRRPAAGFSKENNGRTTKRRADGAPFGRGADGVMEASSKEAQRRFHAVLAVAAETPVAITRRGRRRAVVISAQRFHAYEQAFRALAENTALAALAAALRAADGAPDEVSLKTAEQALAAAKKLNALIGGPLAPLRPRP